MFIPNPSCGSRPVTPWDQLERSLATLGLLVVDFESMKCPQSLGVQVEGPLPGEVDGLHG